VGDVINRGPDSLAVLHYLYDIQDSCTVVLGNHDLHLLAVFAGVAPLKKADTFSDILEHDKASALCTWLRQRPLLHYDDSFNAVMTHAGIYPLWDLATAQCLAQEVETLLRCEEYKPFLSVLYGNEPSLWNEALTGYDRARFIVNAFTRMRVMNRNGHLELDYKGSIENCPQGLMPWFQLPSLIHHSTRILFGHWAQCVLPIPYHNFYQLDTGCVWGRQLTALRLEDNSVFSVENHE
jgi:bis(5'-nucleosyl)-tetraphosphatase (symmetrical)